MVRLKHMMVRTIVVLSLIMLVPQPSTGQSAEEIRIMFTEAESNFLFGEYDLAFPQYNMLLSIMPENNGNILFKIGYCYLNLPDERSKAIPFLEQASTLAIGNARTESFRETNAPLETWFALGTAYRINNELDKAIDAYQRFLRLSEEAGEEINSEFVNQQIAACRNAKKFQEEANEIAKVNMGKAINQGAANTNPAVSFDGNSMVYTQRRGIVNAIFYTVKERGVWQPPMDITFQLGDATDCLSSSLNEDGTELYLYKHDNYEGNIYVSKLVNGEWTKISKLNRNINTRYFESHAAISCDGQRLYFASNRPGGAGELDIYVSERGRGDNWGRAVNLGSTVNTPFNETSPFIIRNDSVLFFASEGHNSMGGYDIYKSYNLGTMWKTPENLGYPLNSTDDDMFFQPKADGSGGFLSIYIGEKLQEIFEVDFDEAAARSFEIKGIISLSDKEVRFSDDFSVHLIETETGDTIDVSFPNEYSGLYSIKTHAGDYRIVYKGLGYFERVVDTIISPFHPEVTVVIDMVLDPDPDYVEEQPVVIIDTVVIYDRIDISAIPQVASIDSSILVTNLTVADVTGEDIEGEEVLYYTVQVIALYNPVDISYFTYITDMVVVYNENDRFYRYTTGRFETSEEATAYRLELIRMGYPDEIFIKKVLRQ